MIKINAKKKGKGVLIKVAITGNGEDITDEAVAIMMQLPKRLAEISPDVFVRFAEKHTEQLVYEIDDEEDDDEE